MLIVANRELVRTPLRNIVARTWPNEYNIMQHPQILHEILDHFQTWADVTQHVVMLIVANWTSACALAQHCGTHLAKRVQHYTTSTNIAWNIGPFSNLSRCYPACCDMLIVANWTSAYALVQHCGSHLAKRVQHYATSTNIAWNIGPFSNLSRRHPTCCDMLIVANWTSAYALVQHCGSHLAKRVQHYATSTNIAWNIGPFSNLSRRYPTCRSRVAKRARHVTPEQWCDRFARGLSNTASLFFACSMNDAFYFRYNGYKVNVAQLMFCPC